MKKLRDTSEFVKDVQTGALVNANAPSLQLYKVARKDRRRLRKLEIKASRVDELEARMASLEAVINTLLTTKKGSTK